MSLMCDSKDSNQYKFASYYRDQFLRISLDELK